MPKSVETNWLGEKLNERPFTTNRLIEWYLNRHSRATLSLRTEYSIKCQQSSLVRHCLASNRRRAFRDHQSSKRWENARLHYLNSGAHELARKAREFQIQQQVRRIENPCC